MFTCDVCNHVFPCNEHPDCDPEHGVGLCNECSAEGVMIGDELFPE